ncbi:probable glutamate receptor [Anabrus simplex]|uniref:probable glutamate receptor n=1 Tax=Anabrus simplex TaxID=316456 RepID=UPI0035A3067F
MSPKEQGNLYRSAPYWRTVLGPSVYFQLMTDATQLMTNRVVPASLPVLVLPSCSPTFNMLVQASRLGLMNKLFSWWVLLDHGTLINISSTAEMKRGLLHEVAKLQTYMVHLNSNMNLVGIHKDGAVVWDVFGTERDKVWCLLRVAQWDSSTKTWSLRKSFKKVGSYHDKLLFRSQRLRGTVLRVGVLLGKPDYNFDCYTEIQDEGQIKLYDGYSIQILNILQDILHFKVAPVGTDSWGFLDDEGVWTGMMGLLVNNEADLVLCHPTVTVERSTAVSFLQPTLSTNRVLVYRAADLPLTEDVLILTFTGPLWLCLLLVLALLAVCLQFSTSQNAKLRPEQTPWTWIEVTLWAIAALCQQGSSNQPQGASCRSVFMVGYLSMYLVYTGFAAGVTSLLALQGRDTHLQLTDVWHMHASFSAYWDGQLKEFFEASDDPVAQVLYSTELRKEPHQLHSLDQLFAHLQKERSITMATRQPVQHFTATQMSSEEACQLTLSTVVGSQHYKALAVMKNSPYYDILNHWLLKVREAGLLRLMSSRNISPPPVCGSGPGYSSATINNVASAIAILISGSAIACLLLFAEKAWYRHKQEDYWMKRTQHDVLQQIQRHTKRHTVVVDTGDHLHLRIQPRH